MVFKKKLGGQEIFPIFTRKSVHNTRNLATKNNIVLGTLAKSSTNFRIMQCKFDSYVKLIWQLGTFFWVGNQMQLTCKFGEINLAVRQFFFGWQPNTINL
jgi:hypothetical protein